MAEVVFNPEQSLADNEYLNSLNRYHDKSSDLSMGFSSLRKAISDHGFAD